MRPADKIVEALLEGDLDPKSFVARQSANLGHGILLDKLRESGVEPETVDGVEVYGMIDDGEMQERVEQGNPGANKWGVSIHTIRPDNWMVDYDDYNTPEEALAAGQDVHRTLTEMFPHLTIHFIDEISPA